jgi:hypothetical protein
MWGTQFCNWQVIEVQLSNISFFIDSEIRLSLFSDITTPIGAERFLEN